MKIISLSILQKSLFFNHEMTFGQRNVFKNSFLSHFSFKCVIYLYIYNYVRTKSKIERNMSLRPRVCHMITLLICFFSSFVRMKERRINSKF